MARVLDSFSAPVRGWFGATFGQPTPPQEGGWPAIQAGEHTLILAPTGSGKTLAAFLWGIDRLGRELAAPPASAATRGAKAAAGGASKPGVRIVYISPLKALNNDIHRNLRVPLRGIRDHAEELGLPFPELRAAVRSGDTPARERRSLANRPPHILVTTPESLYLLLSSPRAREMFRTVHTVIVDEIHTMAGSKRGVHLALSLERLERLAAEPVQRIGLSATIRPLEEVARFLGGFGESPGHNRPDRDRPDRLGEEQTSQPRPVTIVDSGYRKPLELRVETVLEDYMRPPGDSIWPVIIPRLTELIRQHRTTLIFTNNRRLAERTADRLNEQFAAEARGAASGLMADGVALGSGIAALGRGLHENPIRAHHGSMSKEVRLRLERELKAGEMRALVGTSSLELGIDIGSVDLVVQLQSPKGVSQGLQRVGRSGHLVGQTSKGRIIPTHREDLVEAAAVAGGMLAGEVEEVRTPQNALDVLAQQIVAMVSVEEWDAAELLHLVRRAYPYHQLSERAFRGVIEMLSGRYPSEAHGELRPRLAWDRVNDRLIALPGSRMLALTNGGTIPDTGMFGAYLPDRKTKVGELDEEFVFETRVGDSFMLGSQVWRVLDITDDRVVVSEAPGAFARMPFWHGDLPWRQPALGRRLGAFRRQVGERLEQAGEQLELEDLREVRRHWEASAVLEVVDWLRQEHALDKSSARHLLQYLAGQVERGALATDRRLVVEFFEDAVGDPRMVLHSPFGGRVNGAWSVVLRDALRERTGVEVEAQAGDDGILLRFPEAEGSFPDDLVTSIGPEEARQRLLADLANSPVFGARFRQNAARALLLPASRGRRTPFWLQRLRAKDLLQAVKGFTDFPIVAETYRDVLEDVMDLPALEQVLSEVQSGDIEVRIVHSPTPSPVAASLIWNFTNQYLYEWDTPKAEGRLGRLQVSRELLGDLLRGVDLGDLLQPEAVGEVEASLQRTAPGARARTAEELLLVLEELGDLSQAELGARSEVDPGEWLERLKAQGRVAQVELPGSEGDSEPRWVPVEYLDDYRHLACDEGELDEDRLRRLIGRYIRRRGVLEAHEPAARYGLPVDRVHAELERLVDERLVARGRFRGQGAEAGTRGAGEPPGKGPTEDHSRARAGGQAVEYVEVGNLERMHRRSLAQLRRQVRAVPLTTYADFLTAHQHLAPHAPGPAVLREVLGQLRGFFLPMSVWERDVLPSRVPGYRPALLDGLSRQGEVVWVAEGGQDLSRAAVAFFFRGEARAFLGLPPEIAAFSDNARRVHELLAGEGALFLVDIAAALGLSPAAAEAALAELAAAGMSTNDSLDVLRRLSAYVVPPSGRGGRVSGQRSFLEEDLRRLRSEHRLGEMPGARHSHGFGPHSGRTRMGARPSRSALRSASRRVRERLGQTEPVEEQIRHLHEGRWTLVHRLPVLGPELEPDERARRQARQLLERWAVVTRRAHEREKEAWDFYSSDRTLERMEMRGEVRRGYFVAGLPGVQHALPDTVEALRSFEEDPARFVVMNALDPALLKVTGETAEEGRLTFSRVPSTWVVQQRGLPLLAAADSGARIEVRAGAPVELVDQGFAALIDYLGARLWRISVERWNGGPPPKEALELMTRHGFHRGPRGWVWEAPPK